eukprot:g3806.t1
MQGFLDSLNLQDIGRPKLSKSSFSTFDTKNFYNTERINNVSTTRSPKNRRYPQRKVNLGRQRLKPLKKRKKRKNHKRNFQSREEELIKSDTEKSLFLDEEKKEEDADGWVLVDGPGEDTSASEKPESPTLQTTESTIVEQQLNDEYRALDNQHFLKFRIQKQVEREQKTLRKTMKRSQKSVNKGDLFDQEYHAMIAISAMGSRLARNLDSRLQSHKFGRNTSLKWKELLTEDAMGGECLRRAREAMYAMELDKALDLIEEAERYFQRAGSIERREAEIIRLENAIDAAPEHYEAAVKIQKYARRFLRRRWYHTARRTKSSVEIQRIIRGRHGRGRVKRIRYQMEVAKKGSEVMLMATSKYKDEVLQSSATNIQKTFRGRQHRKRAKRRHQNRVAVHIQKIERGHQGRRRVKKVRRNKRATTIQRYTRGARARTRVRKLREEHFMVVFCLISAKHLPKVDTFGKCDPYCVFYSGANDFGRSKVMRKNLNPKWKEGNIFELDLGTRAQLQKKKQEQQQKNDSSLLPPTIVKIYDKNSMLNDLYIGEIDLTAEVHNLLTKEMANVNLEEASKEPVIIMKKIQNFRKNKGHLKVSITLKKNKDL